MDYQDDTLTSASKNRAASRKLFQQWSTNGTNPPRAELEGTTNIQQLLLNNAHLLQKQYNNNNNHLQSMSLNSFDHHQQQQQQQQQQQHCSSSPSPHQGFLHRSPSGAQRKIRQKAQQQHQSQQFPLTNGFSMPSPQQQQQQQQLPPSYGRSVIHENGYKSILDRDEAASAAAGGGNPSVGQLIDRMNRLDSPSIGVAHVSEDHPSSIYRSMPAADSSSWTGGGGSIDKMPMPSSFSSLMGSILGEQQQQQQQPALSYPSANIQFTKPTVQVHPLPVPPRHRSMSAIAPPTAQLKPTPPPLPPKKHSLAMSFLAKRGFPSDEMPNEKDAAADDGQLQQKPRENGDNLRKSLRWASSVPSSEVNSPSPAVEKRPDDTPTTRSSDDKAAKELGEGEDNNFGEVPEGTSTNCSRKAAPFSIAFSAQSPPLSLSSSPSLTSLQNSLQFAADNPDKHSGEQLQELERRRLYSIESLSRKIADREQDRALLCRDLAEIDNIRESLFARIGHNGTLIGRLTNLLLQMEKMADLETKIHFQMERMAPMGRGTDGMVRCLREQLADLHFLRGALEEREGAIDAEMAEELGEAEGLQEWLFCREQLAKLSAERCHLNMRLRDVRTLLESLQSICLMPKTKGDEENE